MRRRSSLNRSFSVILLFIPNIILEKYHTLKDFRNAMTFDLALTGTNINDY